MGSRKDSKTLILLILLLVIVGMAVGYAALSQAIQINGTANITAQWKITFTNIEEGKMVGAETNVEPSYTATTATFDVDLLYPGASAQYLLTVENQGSIDAKLINVDGIDEANAETPTDVKYSIDARSDDSLPSGSKKDYIVTVTWDADATEIPETKTKTATITLNYEQAE